MMAISSFNHQPNFDGKVHKLPILGHFNQLASKSLDKRHPRKGVLFCRWAIPVFLKKRKDGVIYPPTLFPVPRSLL